MNFCPECGKLVLRGKNIEPDEADIGDQTREDRQYECVKGHKWTESLDLYGGPSVIKEDV